MRSGFLAALILGFSLSGQVAGQNNDGGPQPLGDVAKKNDASKKENGNNKAKRVFTDDDMSVRKSPFPSIALQGADNTEEILASIHDFRAKHNAEDTENAIHDWFDAQAEVLKAAIDAGVRMQKHNQLRWESAQDRGPYIYDGDTAKLNERQITERFSQRVDAHSSQDNFQVISRVQQALMKVRGDLFCRPNKTRATAYDWFKILNANGVGSY
jgi:hypothetical protein